LSLALQQRALEQHLPMPAWAGSYKVPPTAWSRKSGFQIRLSSGAGWAGQTSPAQRPPAQLDSLTWKPDAGDQENHA